MNRTEALRGAGAFTVPAALVIGGSMLTLSLTSAGNYRNEAAPPRPAPTVTTTAPAPATDSPRATPQQTSPPAAVVAVHQSGSSGTGGGVSSQARPSVVAPSGPSPRPPAAQQPAPRCNVALAVAALNACLKLGGSR